MKYAKLTIGSMLAILMVLFTVQNMGAVTVRVLFWEVSMSQALLIFMVLATGVVFGWLIAGWLHWRLVRKQKNG